MRTEEGVHLGREGVRRRRKVRQKGEKREREINRELRQIGRNNLLEFFLPEEELKKGERENQKDNEYERNFQGKEKRRNG